MSFVETKTIPIDLLWRLRVDQYHAMIQSGILSGDDPVELLEGWLIVKMPKNPAHRISTHLVRTAIESILPSGWYVDSQEPITLSDSEPEPDVMIVRGILGNILIVIQGPKILLLLLKWRIQP